MYGGATITLNIKNMAGDTIAITMDDSSTVHNLKRAYAEKAYADQNPAMESALKLMVLRLKLMVLHSDLPVVPAGSNTNGFTELNDKKTLASYHFHPEQGLSAFTDGTITFTIPAGYTMRYPPSYRDAGEWFNKATSIDMLMMDIDTMLQNRYQYNEIRTNITEADENNTSQLTKLTAEASDGVNVNVEINAQFVGNDKSTIKISITDLMQHTNANNNPKQVDRESETYFSYNLREYTRNITTETTTQRQLDSDEFFTLVEGIRNFVSTNAGGKRKSRRTRRARTRRTRNRRARTRTRR
jgi:hypothetical protein